MKKQNTSLKKPSHFQITESSKSESSKTLKSPSMFSTSKETQKQEMKKPSDFLVQKPLLNISNKPVRTTECMTTKLRNQVLIDPKSYTTCNVIHSNHNSALIKKTSDGLNIPDASINNAPQNERNIYDLKLALTTQKQEHMLLREELNLINENKLLSEKSFRIKLEQVENEALNFKLKYEEMESKNFLEMKSIYGKYISLQTKYDEDCYLFKEKISSLEEFIHKITDQKDRLQDAFVIERREILSLKQDISQKDVEYKIFVAKNEEKVAHWEEKFETLKNGFVLKEKTMIEKSYSLEAELLESSSNLQELNKVKEQLEISFRNQTKIIESQKKTIETLEKSLSDEIENKTILQGNLKEKEIRNLNLKDVLEEMEVTQESTHKELENIQSAYKTLQTCQTECQEYERTCKTLQMTNEQLNIRSDTLNEMLKMQEVAVNGLPCDIQNHNLLQTWRYKVYQLLILLKTKELNNVKS